VTSDDPTPRIIDRVCQIIIAVCIAIWIYLCL
jgi:hypothetical protein